MTSSKAIKTPITKKTTEVTIVALPESSMMTLSSVIDPLRAANRLSRKPLFSWKIVSADGSPIRLSCGIEIRVNAKLEPAMAGDLLFVVAGFNHPQHFHGRALSILRSASKNFSIIAGVEAGTWILAEANIINTHTVTTHWEDLENFAFAFPKLHVVDQRFVVDRNIWTSGGASPALDMLLHYLRATHRQSLALDVASVFIYNETNVSSNYQNIVSLNRLQAIEPRLAAAIKLMESNIEEPLALVLISKHIGISSRMLELISARHLGVTPKAYYLRLRLQAARRLVLDSSASLLDISVRTGFSSQSNFSRAFKKRYDLSPLKLREARDSNSALDNKI